MMTTRGARGALVPLALAAALALTACGHNRTGDLEDKLLMDPFIDKPFTEDAVTFPAPPVDRDAVPFDVGGRDESPLRFAIDPKSVSIGKDNVVRYTVLITSKTGARNVNYEGLRCDTAERRIYATLRNDTNQWVGNRAVDMNETANAESASMNAYKPATDWQRVGNGGPTDYASALMRSYFCDVRSVAGDGKASTLVRRLGGQGGRYYGP
ncbi:MAG: CNP1-like family protein [Pseudomonadota bacterium]|uniref:CNP1-like family protein n=1 Tax=Ralstonia pickettii TaxID=329 RepID=UPI002714AD48|nr:CNP1-like family protein [Ralstonia pickettii]MEE2978594.1 CNP1-like family protein [Pseudomonadota bacterium]WKZ87030.1 CNP1-like family protein [Ralstonia pickettii]